METKTVAILGFVSGFAAERKTGSKLLGQELNKISDCIGAVGNVGTFIKAFSLGEAFSYGVRELTSKPPSGISVSIPPYTPPRNAGIHRKSTLP